MRKRASRKVRPGDYEVGKGRPPIASRWKPGQSGNPRGRPRGAKNTKVMFYESLFKNIEIVENGKMHRITVLEAIVRRQINLALKGDQKAISFILAMEPDIEQYRAPITEIPGNGSTEELAKIYRSMIRQVP